MKNVRRRKKKSPKMAADNSNKKPPPPGGGGVVVLESEEEKKRTVLMDLVEAFSLSSMEEAAVAVRDAGGDPDKASEILMKGLAEEPSSCSSSSSSSSSSGGGGSSSGISSSDLGSTSGSSEGFVEDLGFKGGSSRQKKKLVASTGMVSTVIGKDYVTRNNKTNKGFENNGVVDVEKSEQFLCSMLGDDCGLSLAVVRDVFCQCGYNVDKALDVLLVLSASSNEQSENDRIPNYRIDNIDDMRFLVDHNDSLIDRRSECTPFSSESEHPDNFWSLGPFSRNYAEVLSSSKANSPISSGSVKSDLPQKVLESLFHIPKSSEHDKGTMNWKNVVKKLQSLGPGFDVGPHVAESQQPTYAKGDAYHVFREGAKQHYDTVKSYYQKAATAYTKGERAYAAYLSDQGKEHTKLAQKADTKASHDIFVARNKAIENVITIDLHGQHVKPAIRMLKLHLLFGSYVHSVQTLRVITGCGSTRGYGKSRLKESVIKLLDREAIEYCEENQGTVLIKINAYREFSFLDSDSDSDSN